MTDIGKLNIKNWIEGSNMFDKNARDYVINLVNKDISCKLKNYDKETNRGHCLCGSVSESFSTEFYCKCCGQKLIK